MTAKTTVLELNERYLSSANLAKRQPAQRMSEQRITLISAHML